MFVSEGSEGVKTATLSFKLNQVLINSSLLQVQASPKKLERKEGNMPITPLDIINCTPEEFFHQMVITKNILKDTVVSDSRGSKHCITTLTKLSAGNTVIPQDIEPMYYSMLERSLLLSYGQDDIEWCQQFTGTAHQLSMIGNKPMTPLHKALYKTLMEVKRKADCEQPLATIDVMNRIAKLFGYGPLRVTTEVSGHYNLFLREVECARPTTSLSRKERKEEAVRVACTECVYSAEELSYYERNRD